MSNACAENRVWRRLFPTSAIRTSRKSVPQAGGNCTPSVTDVWRFKAAIAACVVCALPQQAASNSRLEALIAHLTPQIAEKAIDEIPETSRKLLALRSYLRAKDTLADRWSWTEAEIDAFQGSPEQAALLEEIDQIKADFSSRNPGYELYVNTRVRSLDRQISNWNSNSSVGVAAEELMDGLEESLLSGSVADTTLDSKTLSRWLRGFRNTERAHLAAPGLTRHGQAHAIDFQIMKDGKIVAGAVSDQIAPVWRGQEWDKRLAESIQAAGPSFSGPLTSPDEPWHFDYSPPAAQDVEGDTGK